jgi:spermidine/putrescine transport system substrate-binding protein
VDDQIRSQSPIAAPITRRRMLQLSAGAGVAAFLAACGGGLSASPTAAPASPTSGESPTAGESPTSGASPSGGESPAAGASPGGALVVANWPAYIDLAGAAGEEGVYEPGSSPTLEKFQGEFGIEVDYQEKIEDNNDFFATIEPQLVAGLPTGWDIIVVTEWLAAKIVAKGWAEQIDHANTPTAEKNLREPLRDRPWDPDNDYHYPWQSGAAILGYNVKTLTDNGIAEPTKVADLWDIPSEKVSFLTEVRDTFALTLLKLGIDPDPQKITAEDLQKAHDDMRPLVDNGLRFLDNAYLQEFAAGSVWAAMVWSGDLASSGGEDDRYVFPEEGNVIFTDMVIIPKGAANKRNAEAFIDYYYRVDVAAEAAAYIYYVSPVEGVKEAIADIDDTAPDNPLLFPTPDIVAKSKIFQDLPEELETKMNELYLDLAGA